MVNGITLVAPKDMWKILDGMGKEDKKQVYDFVDKFENNPNSSSLNFEKLPGIGKNLFSARVSGDRRAIIAYSGKGTTFLLMGIYEHKPAYETAKRKTCSVNTITGTLQYYDIPEIKKELEPDIETNEEPDSQSANRPFGKISNKDLIAIGTPEELVSYIKSIPTVEAFYESDITLPSDIREYLEMIISGFDVKDVIEMVNEYAAEMGGQENNDGFDDDFSVALNNPWNKSNYFILDKVELNKMLNVPLEEWRIFLHPIQRKIVEQNYSGPARVLGGAGTGKTVVAMHRAKFLASKITDDKKILFTTFTANLAEDISSNLKKICSDDEMKKIEVKHLDSWVATFLNRNGADFSIVYDKKELKKLWEQALEKSSVDLDYPLSFYQDEWNRIVMPQEALTLEKYAKAKRPGRGIRLDREKRIEVWKVFDAYLSIMKEKKIRDINMAMYECSEIVKAKGTQYAHIIVDEGQDFSDNAFKLIRAIAGDEKPNDIFIVGDTHQRIYRNHPTLSKCGINIRGRSNVLKINYRTTEQTRRYAFSLLKGISFDDMDEGTDSGDKCVSLYRGKEPVVKCFPNATEEINFLTETISDLQKKGVPLRNICVTARTNKILDEYSSQLGKNGFRVYEIKQSKEDDFTDDAIRIATMHRIKGLEFQYVFIVSANKNIIPLDYSIDYSDSISEEESKNAEKCLLYVALTRAQKQAFITSYGKQSEFIL